MYLPYTRQVVVAYDNVFARGLLTASSSPAGGEAENAVDGFTWDYWRPAGTGPHSLLVDLGAAQPVDYIAVHAHNLAVTGGSISLESSTDGAGWDHVLGPFMPIAGRPYLGVFPQIAARYYRVTMTGVGSILGVLQAGKRLVLPEGQFVGENPSSLNPQNQILNSTSEGGQLLGRALIRTSTSDKIKQERVTQSFARTEWQAFVDHAALKPFFYAWRHDDRPDEVMYAWATGDSTVTQGSNGFMSVELAIEGQA